ncbi:hypothetical protein MASR1M48_16660 [Lactococcus petauri]
MALETHFGIEIDIIRFPEETKKKIIEIRNQKIKAGEINYTFTDVLVWSVNMAHIVTMKQAQAESTPVKDNLKLKTPTLPQGDKI